MDRATTGIGGLDKVVQYLRLGDNVVFQVDNVKDYLRFVSPFIEKAKKDRKKIVYIRFAKHMPLIENDPRVKTCQLNADAGFESFSKEIHDIIAREGVGAYYVFDCLSDLISAWATDLMIGNFFMITCPYLFRLDTVAYFSILRDHHAFKTIARIRETTQLLIDVYDFEGKIFIQPLKVWNRYSPTMFLPHMEEKGEFLPLVNSVDAARLFSHISVKGAESAERYLDYWDRLFLKAGELDREGKKQDQDKMLDGLCRIMIGREPRMLSLVRENLVLEDLLAIKARMIGTGFIGGKALGMILSRKILLKDKKEKWEKLLEPHDSFFIGSDVFYTYIVENGWWELWLEQKGEGGYFEKAAELREKMLYGKFPDEIKEQFHQLIEYFGQSPIIIRSSSLLEDGFGNAFAGKYESIFSVNQGSPDERYQKFIDTVRRVFASSMSEDALSYRMQRGLSRQDEQMALLVMRVSGRQRKKYFIPFVAGVGVSYNTFIWHEKMDPKAGLLRLVFGLGTRAVNRVEGDYPRVVALDQPFLKPYANMNDLARFSQHDVDVLNIDANLLESVPLSELLKKEPEIDLDLIGRRDREAETKMKELGIEGESWVLTFDGLLAKGGFANYMREILKTLEKKYEYPVDIEFTLNFLTGGEMQINLLQCRPLQAKGAGGRVRIPKNIAPESVVFSSEGNFMGGSVDLEVRRIIYVDPAGYADLLMTEKFEVARLIGRLNRQNVPTLLIGPGRWGTRDPSLGVPVTFAEINNVSVLVEIDDPERGFSPELSFGSHFFLDLVEAGIFYAALFAEKKNVVLNREWLAGLPNMLGNILPEKKPVSRVLKVHDLKKSSLRIMADIASQKLVCLK